MRPLPCYQLSGLSLRQGRTAGSGDEIAAEEIKEVAEAKVIGAVGADGRAQAGAEGKGVVVDAGVAGLGVQVDALSSRTVDGGTSDVGCVALDEDGSFDIVRPGEGSAVDGVVGVLSQAESVISADVELDVAVAGDGAVVEGVVLVEIAEGDDAGVAGASAGAGAVVGDGAVVVGVVRGVVLEADAVVGLHAVLDDGRVEGVVAGGTGFERAAVGAGSIDGEVSDGAVGGGLELKTEGSVIEAAGAGSALIFAGDGQAVDGQVALFFKPHGRAALSAAGASDGDVSPGDVEIAAIEKRGALHVFGGDAGDGGVDDPSDGQAVDVGAVAIEGDVFDGDAGEGAEDFLSSSGVHRGVIGIVESGGDGDGVTGDGSDLEEFAAATGGVAAGVGAAVGRVFAALLEENEIAGANAEGRGGGEGGSEFIGDGAEGDSGAVIGIAVAGAADGEDGAGRGVVDDGATGAIDGDIREIEGELGGGFVGAAGEEEGGAAGESSDGGVDGGSIVGGAVAGGTVRGYVDDRTAPAAVRHIEGHCGGGGEAGRIGGARGDSVSCVGERSRVEAEGPVGRARGRGESPAVDLNLDRTYTQGIRS